MFVKCCCFFRFYIFFFFSKSISFDDKRTGATLAYTYNSSRGHTIHIMPEHKIRKKFELHKKTVLPIISKVTAQKTVLNSTKNPSELAAQNGWSCSLFYALHYTNGNTGLPKYDNSILYTWSWYGLFWHLANWKKWKTSKNSTPLVLPIDLCNQFATKRFGGRVQRIGIKVNSKTVLLHSVQIYTSTVFSGNSTLCT